MRSLGFWMAVILMICIHPFIYGQQQKKGNFEGNITYEIKFEGENAAQVAPFAPKSYVYSISGDNVRMQTEGGMAQGMMGDIIVDGESGETYMLRPDEKVAYRLTSEAEETQPNEIEVTPLDEKANILGYECRKYLVVVNTDNGKITNYIWATKDIKANLGKAGKGNVTEMFYKDIDGFPLKMENSVPDMDIKMILTASKVDWSKVDKSQFEVPAGYTVKEFNMQEMMGR